jgi:hypothetical protein
MPENRVIATQKAFVHDAICFFVAFSLTDFVSWGFISFLLTLATSAKNAASDFFSLSTIHHSLIISLVLSFPQLQQPQPSDHRGVRFAGHQPERTRLPADTSPRTRNRRLLPYRWLSSLHFLSPPLLRALPLGGHADGESRCHLAGSTLSRRRADDFPETRRPARCLSASPRYS